MRALAPAFASALASAVVALAGCGAIAIEVARPATTAGAGATAPGFTLSSPDGAVTLADELGRGDVLLVFYRGFW